MGEGNRLNIRKSSCQWDVFGCEIFSQGKEVKASLFGSRAGQPCKAAVGAVGCREGQQLCVVGQIVWGKHWMQRGQTRGRGQQETQGDNKESNGAREGGGTKAGENRESWEKKRQELQAHRMEEASEKGRVIPRESGQGWALTTRSPGFVVNLVALVEHS